MYDKLTIMYFVHVENYLHHQPNLDMVVIVTKFFVSRIKAFGGSLPMSLLNLTNFDSI